MASPPPIRVLLVDDHDLFRDGIAGIIRAQPDMLVVEEAADGLEALVKAQALKPDVILMDINMPGLDGLEATRLISQAAPECNIVILTMRDEDARLLDAVRFGARGYLLKTIRAQQLVEMIRLAAKGGAALTPSLALRMMEVFRQQSEPTLKSETGAVSSTPTHATDVDELTTREREVLALLAEGFADKEIAAALSVSLYTVKAHVRSILSKLQVDNRREAARRSRDT